MALDQTLWLNISLGLIVFGAVVWAGMDAYERTDHGCLWVIMFVCFAPVTIPLYVIMRIIADRPKKVSDDIIKSHKMQDELKTRFSSDIHKLQFFGQAEDGQTLYDPAEHGGEQSFRAPITDSHAEMLIATGSFSECWNYLIDIYAVASRDSDLKRREAYRRYIHQLPDGAEMLARWEEEQGLSTPDTPEKPRRDDDELPF